MNNINEMVNQNQESSAETELYHRYQNIVNHAVDGIITIDQNGLIESFNPAACKLFEYSLEEVIGKNVKILMNGEHKLNHDKYIQQYLNTGVKKIIGIGREVKGIKKHGGELIIWLSISEFKLGDKIIFNGVIHDITELKKAEHEIIRLNSELKVINKELESRVENRTELLARAINDLKTTNELLQIEFQNKVIAEEELRNKSNELIIALEKEKQLLNLKSKFVSIASHEFRTPLSTILSSAQLSLKYIDLGQNEKATRHIKKIEDAISHLNGILIDILSLSKIDEGKVICETEQIDIKEFIFDFIEGIKGLAKPNQNFVIKSVAPNSFWNTDKRLLTNILFNLVSNSIKYSEKDIRIEMDITPENRLCIKIVDQGIGIPDKDKGFLFERFYRASNSINIQGSGLGLSIVKSYLSLLRGTIEIESELDKGTTVTIFLDAL